MHYKINWGVTDGAFAVPDYVVDTLLKNTSPASAKVMLYIFRHKDNCSFDANEIASAVGKGVSAEDVEDALSDMELTKLIYKSDAPVPAPDLNVVKSSVPQAEPVENPKPSAEKISAERSKERAAKMLSPKEISERISDNKDIEFLFFSAEEMLGKVLNHTEHRALIWMYDYYGLKADIILMIIDYCKSINKTAVSYIETIAKSWYEKEIFTHEAASAEIMRMQSYHTIEGQVKSKLELNRSLTSTEREYVDNWAKFGYNIEQILLAYEKTIAAINKPSLSYMNTIITRWHDMGLYKTEDIERAEIDYKNANLNKSKSTAKQTDSSTPKKKSTYDLKKIMEFSKNNIPDFKE